MCGIALVLSVTEQSLGALLGAMSKVVHHRGPDDEGYLLLGGDGVVTTHWGDDTPLAVQEQSELDGIGVHLGEVSGLSIVGMAHRRLSIVDLSPLGHQPMSDASGRYWISYNGEVYNHLELRVELELCGHVFRSHTDTEVILAAYAEWGVGCLRRFNGMWAFAILDRHSGTLFVARDRLGVKPLYYTTTSDGLVAFASEIKQFTVLPRWQARANRQAVHDFLVWNVLDHTDATLFQGVFQVPAGHYSILNVKEPMQMFDSSGRLASTAWYELPAEAFAGSYDEAAHLLGDLLDSSIELRLRADVPVGSCLSGGLDSSSLVCMMSRQLMDKRASSAKVFSACSDESSVDEQKWIDMVVSQTGVDSYKTLPDLDHLFDELPNLTWHQDEPFGSTSIYAQWCVYQLVASSDVRVILNGQGADELLAGYHSFLAPRFTGLLRRGRFGELCKEIAATNRRLGYSKSYALKRMADMVLPNGLRQMARAMAGYASASNNDWLNQTWMKEANVHVATASVEQSGSVRDLSQSLMMRRHLPMLLHWEDRNSMACSVESRIPFLDYRLVEFCLSLPDEYKLYRGWTKRVMRTSMKGVLPEPIRIRTDKIGFATPEEIWIKDRAPEKFRSALVRAVEQSAGILNSQAVSCLDEMVAGKRPFSSLPWRMISLGAWMSRFDVKA